MVTQIRKIYPSSNNINGRCRSLTAPTLMPWLPRHHGSNGSSRSKLSSQLHSTSRQFIRLVLTGRIQQIRYLMLILINKSDHLCLLTSSLRLPAVKKMLLHLHLHRPSLIRMLNCHTLDIISLPWEVLAYQPSNIAQLKLICIMGKHKQEQHLLRLCLIRLIRVSSLFKQLAKPTLQTFPRKCPLILHLVDLVTLRLPIFKRSKTPADTI